MIVWLRTCSTFIYLPTYITPVPWLTCMHVRRKKRTLSRDIGQVMSVDGISGQRPSWCGLHGLCDSCYAGACRCGKRPPWWGDDLRDIAQRGARMLNLRFLGFTRVWVCGRR